MLYKGAKSFLEFVGQYKMYIDSPISDMYKLKLGVGLTTVESSILGAFVGIVSTTVLIILYALILLIGNSKRNISD